MTEKIYSNPDIYKINVPLPNNPLQNLNSYCIISDGEALIIDTGFHMTACLEALKNGLSELGVDVSSEKTSMFLTHLHSDHTGLVFDLMPKGSKIYMSRIDYEYFCAIEQDGLWLETENLFVKEGFPCDSISVLRETNPAISYAPGGIFEAITLEDKDQISIGHLSFECVLTPGHTPGHACLYLEDKKIMFLGDHVLFNITPNITNWIGVEDSLADYLESLKKLMTYDISVALPAHRLNQANVYERIQEILTHHEKRLKNTLQTISDFPGLTAYEIAGHMKWHLRGRDWNDFPMHQKWFAVGETLSHLDYLRIRGQVQRFQDHDVYRYEKSTSGQK